MKMTNFVHVSLHEYLAIHQEKFEKMRNALHKTT